MPYCYACRNAKPATHAHFQDYGALALRPPKRHITEIEALWDTLGEEQRAQAIAQGRQILADAGADVDRPPAPRRVASSSPTPRPRAARANAPQEEGEGEGVGMAGVVVAGLAVGAGLLGLIYAAHKGAGENTQPAPPQGPQGPTSVQDLVRDYMARQTPPAPPQAPDTGPYGA